MTWLSKKWREPSMSGCLVRLLLIGPFALGYALAVLAWCLLMLAYSIGWIALGDRGEGE